MRLTKVLFWLSDICAWILLTFSALSALAMPFLGVVAEQMDRSSVSWPGIIGTSILWLAVGAGAYGLTRRRPLSLALVVLPSIGLAIAGSPLFALAWLASVLIIFGTPIALVFFEARASAPGGET